MRRQHAHALAVHGAIADMIALNEIRRAAVLPGVVGMDAASRSADRVVEKLRPA